MLEEDVHVWWRFLDKFASRFLGVYYDVRVGGGDPSTYGRDPKWAMLTYRLLAKRIDAIGELTDELWIIEVTPHPGLRALGQCLGYLQLWNLDPKIDIPANVHIVCEFLDPDMSHLFEANKIVAHVV